MKMFLTEFQRDDRIHEGPVIHAVSQEKAEEVADRLGLVVVARLDDIYVSEYNLEEDDIIIH
jgi:hypothetical protein